MALSNIGTPWPSTSSAQAEVFGRPPRARCLSVSNSCLSSGGVSTISPCSALASGTASHTFPNSSLHSNASWVERKAAVIERIRLERSRRRIGDRNLTAPARAIAWALRGASSVMDVADVMNGAIEAGEVVRMGLLTTVLQKVGMEGNVDAAVAVVKWMEREWAAHVSIGLAEGVNNSSPSFGASSRPSDSCTYLPTSLEPNVFTYNSLLGALKRCHQWEAMESVVQTMQERGVGADAVTMNTMVSALLEQGRANAAWTLLERAGIDLWFPEGHVDRLVEKGMLGSDGANTALQGEDALVVSSTISLQSHAWLESGLWRGIQPDAFTVRIMLPACRRINSPEVALSLVRAAREEVGERRASGRREAESRREEHQNIDDVSSKGSHSRACESETGGSAYRRQQEQLPEVEVKVRRWCNEWMKRVAVEMRTGGEKMEGGVMQGSAHTNKACRVVQVLHHMLASDVVPDSETYHWALLACCRASRDCREGSRAGKVRAEPTQEQQELQSDSSDSETEEDDVNAGNRNGKRSQGKRSTRGGDEGSAVRELRMVLREMWQQSGGQERNGEDLILQPLVAHEVVVALGRAGRCWEALAVMEWMDKRGGRVVRRGSLTVPGDKVTVSREQAQVHGTSWQQGQEQEQEQEQGQIQGQVQPQAWKQTEREVERQLAVLVSAAGRRGQWRWARRVVLRMEAAGMRVSQAVWRVVVGAAGRARNAAAAVAVFEAMVEAGHVADVASYGVLLSALEKSGEYQLAEQVWSHMAGAGLRVNKEAITTMIMVFGHLGKYSEAVRLFNLLSWPQATHTVLSAGVNRYERVNGISRVTSASRVNGSVAPQTTTPLLPITPCYCNGHPNGHGSSHVNADVPPCAHTIENTALSSDGMNGEAAREDSGVNGSHHLSAWSTANGEHSMEQGDTSLFVIEEAEGLEAHNHALPRSELDLSRQVLQVLEREVRGRQQERASCNGSMAAGHSAAVSGTENGNALELSLSGEGAVKAGRVVGGSTSPEVDVAAVNALLTVCAKTGEGEGALTWLDMMEACPFTPPNHTSYYMTAKALLKAGKEVLAAEVAQRGIQQRGEKSAALRQLVTELSRTYGNSSKSSTSRAGRDRGDRFMQATGKDMAVV